MLLLALAVAGDGRVAFRKLSLLPLRKLSPPPLHKPSPPPRHRRTGGRRPPSNARSNPSPPGAVASYAGRGVTVPA
jgi:hypothetical protein